MVKLLLTDRQKMITIFKELVKNQKNGKEKGVIDFNYDHILELSKGHFKSKSHISLVLSALQSNNEIKQLVKGNIGRLSRWDVRKLLEIDEAESNLVKEIEERSKESLPNSPKVNAEDDKLTKERRQEETLETIRSSINEMVQFLQKIPDEMIGHLKELTKELDMGDPKKAERLLEEKEVLRKMNQDLLKERESYKEEIEALKKKIEEGESSRLRKHYIIRQRNRIRDEIEQHLASPTWTQRNRTEHLKMTIDRSLAEILNEIGIKDFEEDVQEV